MKSSLFFHMLLGSIFGWQNPHIVSIDMTNKQVAEIPANNTDFAKLFNHDNHQEKQVVNSRRNCQVYAYTIDTDPQGLNVRSAPNSSARVVKKLPTNTPGVFVDITASQGNWMEINKAESDSGTTLFQGKGWVYASLLGTTTRGYEARSVPVYASNNNRSRVLGRIPSNREVKLLSCNGEWAYVSYQQLQGWIARIDQCGNPLTTCP
ncbi:SH3 domain-containing protein [Aerosakkonema sp. BLCC-F183]|uniref:SH3 domain-containing protein n=1 Tax=Aerosakkonema sp. BLCC-F183 TaxID=3342834 RepID=UPI0035BA88CE